MGTERELCKQLHRKEAEIHDRLQAQVRVFTPEEIEEISQTITAPARVHWFGANGKNTQETAGKTSSLHPPTGGKTEPEPTKDGQMLWPYSGVFYERQPRSTPFFASPIAATQHRAQPLEGPLAKYAPLENLGEDLRRVSGSRWRVPGPVLA